MLRPIHKPLRTWTTLFLLVLVSVLQPARVLAQGSVTGSVMGTITDATQALAPGVAVKLRNSETNETRATTTGRLGNYEFLNVPIGRYRITRNALASRK